MRFSQRLVVCLAVVVLPLALALPAVGADKAGAAPASKDCLACHADKDIKGESARGQKLNLHVAEAALAGSAHEALQCTDCHDGAKSWEEVPHNAGKPLTLKCAECHATETKAYEEHCIHGQVRKAGNPRAPACSDCHGGHQILPHANKESLMSHWNQPTTCGKCHGSETPVAQEATSKRRLVERYCASVHWQSVKEGKPAATCSDCHGSHSILPSSDSASSVTRIALLTACGKCHAAEVQAYSSGSHGRTLLRGNLDVPTCTTCHGDHDMMSLKTTAGGKRNYAGTEICIWCHGNQRMMARYALDTSPVESYMRDFHGLTQRGTEGTSATCADCHDAHRSLPSSHPESRMHLSNRGTTCGKCHGKTSDSFIMSFTHRLMSVEQGVTVKKIVVIAYIILIIGTIGGMAAHNFLIWLHALRRKRAFQKARGEIERLNRFERIWHWTLFISFSVLVFTGFMLKYPDSVVFRWMYTLGFLESMRSYIHRLAAVVLVGDAVVFLWYMLLSKAGWRKWWTEMLPSWRDAQDAYQTILYYLGRRKDRPLTGVFGYVEKSEYWALIWGTAIMVVTGVILWFPKSVPANWPSWFIEVARLIHFYEAILAALAIVVWHLFHTMFHPAEYPMDTSWLTGKLTRREAEHRFTPEAIEAQRPPPGSAEEPTEPEPAEWQEPHDKPGGKRH